MYEAYAVSVIVEVLAIIILVLFLLWLVRYRGNFGRELESEYNLVEIGYLRDFVKDKIDTTKIRTMLNFEMTDNKFRRKLESEMIKKYFGENKEGK